MVVVIASGRRTDRERWRRGLRGIGRWFGFELALED